MQQLLTGTGLPFTLGSLYNANNKCLIAGLSPWSREEIQTRTVSRPSPNSSIKVDHNMSLSKKAELLKIDGKMELDILSGAFKVSGSAAYVNDSNSKKSNSTVTYVYDVHTKFEELWVEVNERLGESQPDLAGATHVVTGIQYGGKAVFEFEISEKDFDSKKQKDGSGKGSGGVAKLAKLTGLANFKMTESEKEEMKNVKCRYQGDFLLEPPPLNFVDAAKAIVELKASNASTPIKVYLTAIGHFYGVDSSQKPMKSDAVVQQAKDFYEALNFAIAIAEEAVEFLTTSPWMKQQEQVRKILHLLQVTKNRLNEQVASQKDLPHWEIKFDETLDGLQFGSDGIRQLRDWAEAVRSSIAVLRVVLNKFEETKVEILATPQQKLEFEISGVKSDRRLILFRISNSTFDWKKAVEAKDDEFFDEAFKQQIMQIQEILCVPESKAAEASSDEAKDSEPSMYFGLGEDPTDGKCRLSFKQRNGTEWRDWNWMASV